MLKDLQPAGLTFACHDCHMLPRKVDLIRPICAAIIIAIVGFLPIGNRTPIADAGSPRSAGQFTNQNPRCLTLPEPNSQACPPGSPTLSAVSPLGDYATTPNGTVYKSGLPIATGINPAAPIIGVTLRWGDTSGYWLAGSDGGVFSLGGAPYYGSMGGKALNAPIVGIASTLSGGGYWLVAADGGVFAFGDAAFEGSMGGRHLNAPITSITSGGNGVGYYLVGADGGVFAFGGGKFYGSMAGRALNGAVVGITPTGDLSTPTEAVLGSGYVLAGSDGGIFAFGNAPFDGSLVGTSRTPVVGLFTIEDPCHPTDLGYLVPDLVMSDGTIYGPLPGNCSGY